MKVNGKKIRSSSMKRKKKWNKKLRKINKECKNRIGIRKIERRVNMKFLTNFSKDDESIYRRAIIELGLDVYISNRAYYFNGTGLIRSMKSIYMVNDINKKHKFWDLVSKYNDSKRFQCESIICESRYSGKGTISSIWSRGSTKEELINELFKK